MRTGSLASRSIQHPGSHPHPHLGQGKPQGDLSHGQSQLGPWTSGLWRGPRPIHLLPILPGHEDTFTIDTNSGNLTMTRSVDSPKTFLLWVKVGPLPRFNGPFLSLRLLGLPFKDLLVTAASLTPRGNRRIRPATP